MKKKRIKKPLTKGVAKVPVVMQMEALECGAACLTMILAYYGKWIPLEQAREDTGVSRDGSKAGNIVRAARYYGLDADGYSFEFETLKEQAIFPCIIHWEFNHFVVLKGFKGGKVYINDPARGDIILTDQEFDEGYTGVCLVFSPGENFEPMGQQKSMLAFTKKQLEGTGSIVAFLGLCVCILSICGVCFALLSRFFMDHLLSGKNPSLLLPFIFLLSLITCIMLLVCLIQAVNAFKIRGKLAVLQNTKYFWHVLHLPMRFFSQRLAADIDMRRMASAAIADLLVNIVAPVAIQSMMLVIYLMVMLRYSVWMTVGGLICVAINAFVAMWISKKRINVTRVMLRDQSKLYATTLAGIEMIETIKASGAEKGYFEKWSGYQASVNTQKARFASLDVYWGKIPEFITSFANNLVLVMGVYLVMRGEFSSGMVLAFSGLLVEFFKPAQSIVETGQQIQEMRSQMERIDDVMEYAKDSIYDSVADETDRERGLQKLSGKLTMKHVSFGYCMLNEPLISDFSLELKPGKSVALVGGSGSGKSTLGKLISGLYRPWEGEILYDSKPIDKIDRDVFTGSLAVVNQEITLFEDTIANNIRMWDKAIEDFEVILAARDAQIHDDIVAREKGYQYVISEGGHDLSGGQRQRIEIARVLAQDPTIIIMDEATSALDAQTEYDLIKSVRNRGITSIVIAHRVSTIRDCDEIIVLDKGKIVERGTHDELMANNNLYTRLVASE